MEKIRSLSLQHYKLVSNISRLYKKLMEIYPHNRDIAEFYLHFVVAVGNDVEYAIRLV